MDKKNEMERLKQERAAERERKEKEKMKENEKKKRKRKVSKKSIKQKRYEESDSDSSISIPELSDGEDSDWYKDSSDEDTFTQEKDNFVIVEYKGSHFLGKIVQVVADGYEMPQWLRVSFFLISSQIRKISLLYKGANTKENPPSKLVLLM